MSRENVDLHRRALDAFNARDVEATALAGPSFEVHSMMTVPGGADYEGRDALRRWLADLEDAWGADFRIEPEAFFDLGEETLAWQVLKGRGRQSGAEVALPTAAVIRWHDGLAVYTKAYAKREEALTDLGLSEDALEPIEP